MNTRSPQVLARRFRVRSALFFRLACASACLLAFVAAGSPARAWETTAESLLAVSPDPRTLRAALEKLARESKAHDPQLASSAYYWRGVSLAREGQADSAIANLNRAAQIFTFEDEQVARADAWIARGRKADVETAAGLMMQVAPFASCSIMTCDAACCLVGSIECWE